MKIKILHYLIFFSLFFICHHIKADVILFDSKSIEIEDEGNLIYSGKGTAKIPNQKLTIKSDRSVYNKSISQLLVKDNFSLFDHNPAYSDPNATIIAPVNVAKSIIKLGLNFSSVYVNASASTNLPSASVFNTSIVCPL